MAEALSASFYALSLETLGGFSPSAQNFVKLVADFAFSSDSGWSRTSVINGLGNSIAIAIQKGNAAAINAGVQQARAFGPVSSRAHQVGVRARNVR